MANISSRLTDSQKSAIFMYFAIYVMQMDISKAIAIPDDILTKNKLVNWRDFVATHFELRRDSFVSKELVFKLFKSSYPDFDYSAKDIIKALTDLPADFNVSYEKDKRDTGLRGIFLGLYSIHEQDNVKPTRDLAYEALVMNEDAEDTRRVPRTFNFDVDFDMSDLYNSDVEL